VAKLDPALIRTEPRVLGELAPRVLRTAVPTGVVALVVGFVASLIWYDLTRLTAAYLVSFCYFLSLSLGALFFVALQHVARAGWSVVVRRLAEMLSANVGVMAVLAVPVLLGVTALYGWTHEATGPEADLLRGKFAYLNVPFFVARLVIYFAVWIGLARYFYRRSLSQDETGQAGLTLTMSRMAGLAIVLYALTVTFASFDLIMSLTPAWYSTIFGVYFFSGGMVACMAGLCLLAMCLQAAGRLGRAITREHYHDLGKLLFGFVFFWGYIAFSQYLLIWYGNIPEETQWYLTRQSGPWLWVSLALLFGNFFIPFLGLLPRSVKRRKLSLAFWSVWLLIMHWIDVYWLVTPTHSPDRLPFGLPEIGCLVGLGALFLAGLVRVAGQNPLVPTGDPRLGESLAFENA
jgi:hypothetical protein